MKKLLISIAVGSFTLLQGCATMGGYGMGSDSQQMNLSRGAEGAQITQAQEEQYARQQRVVAREVQLDNMKRRSTTSAIKDTAGTTNSVVNTIRNVTNLFR